MLSNRVYIISLVLLLAAFSVRQEAKGQNVEIVDDNECGCELVFIDGIETTRSGDLYGFRSIDGTIIAENQYKYVDQFHGEYCKVYLDEGRCGLIDRSGREIIPCIYDDLEYPSCNRVLVIKGGLCGHCDLNGNIVVPLQYRQASTFSEGCAVAMIDIDQRRQACIFIDTMGQQLFGRHFANARPFRSGLAQVNNGQGWTMIDHSSHEMIAAQEMITECAGGFFFAGTANGMALYNRSSRLTPYAYFPAGLVGEGRIPVVRDGLYGFLDTTGKEIIPCTYHEVGSFVEGRTMVRKDTLYGIIDTIGRTILPIEYSNKTPHGEKYMYHDGRALVEKGGKLGFVDIDGNIVIPLVFSAAYQFADSLAAVKHQGNWGYIDTKGDIYMPFIFDIASPFRYGRAEVVYQGNASKVDRTGRCIKNCKGIIAWREIVER